MTSLFHCLGIISRKNFSNWHFSPQLVPFDTCSPVMHHAEELGSIFSMPSLWVLAGCCQGLPKPPPLQGEQAQIPLPSLTVQALQLLPILVASVEDTPEEWGYNLFPQSLKKVQMLLSPLLPGSLLAHVQLAAYQDCRPLPQIRLNQAMPA